MIVFDWDENKNQKNQVKHGISFEEAKTVFWDDNAIMFDDVAHSEEEEYDIDSLNPRKNPYAKELKKQITIKLASSVTDYFKNESKDTGIPYQTLINLYLEDCVKKEKKLEMVWN